MVGFSSVVTDLDYSRDGKQIGSLRLVQSANVMGWQSVLIPVVCVRNGDGPTLLLLGGTHGDEVDGPVALMKLIRSLQPGDIRGRVIMVPALNYPAVEAGQRGAPSDGRDLNRNFPGRPDGSIAEMIAHYVDAVLLPMSDVVIDLHAGGRANRYLPSLWLHDEDVDPDLWRKTLEAARAFGAPFTVVSGSLGGGMAESATRRNCAYISTEAGGAASVDPEILAMYEIGIRRVMTHMSIRPPETGQSAQTSTRMLRVPGGQGYVLAEDNGFLEPLVKLGDPVIEGQVIGRIYRIERPSEPAAEVVCGIRGLVYGLRWASQVRRADRLVCIAQDS